MIAINQMKIEMRFDDKKEVKPDKALLAKKAARLLGVKAGDIKEIEILRHSIDARKKPQLFHVYTLGVKLGNEKIEEKILRRRKNANISLHIHKPYIFPESGERKPGSRPVIIGMGPAGLFCGYMLAKHGYKPILLERGFDVETRTRAVERFWQTGELDASSNVQFGEGGAGAFSDGKLNTLVNDKDGRNREVLRVFTQCGAPPEIMYESKPHIGTDVLKAVVANMREFILQNGGSVHFGAKATGFEIENGSIAGVKVTGFEIENGSIAGAKAAGFEIENGSIAGAKADDSYEYGCVIKTEIAILATGHSARDMFEYLDSINIPMEAKSFAIGLRVEHPQCLINEAMYGKEHGNKLSAAPYKLMAKTKTGRGVYSFCMCPGGYVVNASSEEGRLAINGMSYSDRGAKNANSAIIVQVTPEDYGNGGPLAGVEFQRRLEEKAYKLGGGKIPVQYYGDYVKDRASVMREDCNKPCAKGEYMFANLRGLLPKECEAAFIEGMGQFDRNIKGFAGEEAILSGVESRTSSPVRICRGENMQSPQLAGLYPCGEGAGYAGGIMSAAMDGMMVAERIAGEYRQFMEI